jgi:hypothetical protein
MASDALRRLAARFGSTLAVSGGYRGYTGYSPEKPGFSCNPDAPREGLHGLQADPAVTPVTPYENAGVTKKSSLSNAVTSVTAVTPKNDQGDKENADELGLSAYTIRELAHWYEEEGNRRRVGLDLDQRTLDRDLRRLLAERGVFPEFIRVEFERVMRAVFVRNDPWAPPSTARAQGGGRGSDN